MRKSRTLISSRGQLRKVLNLTNLTPYPEPWQGTGCLGREDLPAWVLPQRTGIEGPCKSSADGQRMSKPRNSDQFDS